MSTPLERLRARLARKAAARQRAGAPSAGRSPGDVTPPPPKAKDVAAAAASVASGGAEASAAAAEPVEPRVVRRIVWGYAVGVLPVPWLMGYKRLKALLEREGFGIRVDLLPLSGLPDGVDLLFVPDELADAARAAVPEARVIALEGRPEQTVFQGLVAQLRAGTELRAPDPAADAPTATEVDEAAGESSTSGFVRPRGTIVRYQGWERVD